MRRHPVFAPLSKNQAAFPRRMPMRHRAQSSNEEI
jgi:hypothetical protein